MWNRVEDADGCLNLQPKTADQAWTACHISQEKVTLLHKSPAPEKTVAVLNNDKDSLLSADYSGFD